jgi:phosphohistidine phosphatase
MRVYFLRHGRSASQLTWTEDDGLRPLTEEGIEGMRREAATFAALGVKPDVIITSPLTRARQTAEIVAESMGMSEELVEDERLAPGFDSVRLAKIIDDYPNAESIMVVGHEPDMSAAVSKLIGGGRLQLKKGGLATVEVVERVGDFVFGVLVSLMTPAHLRAE